MSAKRRRSAATIMAMLAAAGLAASSAWAQEPGPLPGVPPQRPPLPGRDTAIPLSTTPPFVPNAGYSNEGLTNTGITSLGVQRPRNSLRGTTSVGIVGGGTNDEGIETFLRNPNRLRARDFATELAPVLPAPLPGTGDDSQSGIPTAAPLTVAE